MLICSKFHSRMKRFQIGGGGTKLLPWFGIGGASSGGGSVTGQVARLHLGGTFWLLDIQYGNEQSYVLESEGHNESFHFPTFLYSLYSYASRLNVGVSDCVKPWLRSLTFCRGRCLGGVFVSWMGRDTQDITSRVWLLYAIISTTITKGRRVLFL